MKGLDQYNNLLEILHSFNPNLRIESFQTPFCDFLVHDKEGSSLSFAVEVKLSKQYNQAYYDKLISSFSLDVIYHGMPKCPLALLLIDQDRKTASIALIIEWAFGKATINNPPRFIELTASNKDVVMGAIMKADETIRFLPSTLLNVVQRITFSYKIGNRNVNSFILYFRQLSSNYKMKARRGKSERERFERILKGTPQEDYPNDAFDEMVLGAVKKVYPNAELKSSLLLFSSELRDLECEIKQYRHNTARIDIFPPNDLSVCMDFSGVKFEKFMLDLFTTPLTSLQIPEQVYSGILECKNKEEYYSILNSISKVNNINDLLLGNSDIGVQV